MKRPHPYPQDHVEEEVDIEIEDEDKAKPELRANVGFTGLPSMDVGVVQQVLAFLSGLEGTKATPMVQATQVPFNHPIITTIPKMDGARALIPLFFHYLDQ